jgi:hypothetical protein
MPAASRKKLVRDKSLESKDFKLRRIVERFLCTGHIVGIMMCWQLRRLMAMRTDQARIAAMLLLTLRGTPTVYYGDEIAMKQVAMAPDQIRDPLGKNVSGRGLGWVRHDDSSRAPALWQGCSLRTQSGPDVGFGQVYPYQACRNQYRASEARPLQSRIGQVLSRRRCHDQPTGSRQPFRARRGSDSRVIRSDP